ncbi:MAG: flavodoxin family protein [Legionellales bacterium]|nr:flavodoxin family protein [Legionellales bacterium]
MLRKTLPLFITTLLFLATYAFANPTVLIVYYSASGEQGKVGQMAQAVASGVKQVAGVDVKLLPVSEAKTSDLDAAQAIILGTPVHHADMALPMKEFIHHWPIQDHHFANKIGAVFVSGGKVAAGLESTQLGLIRSMLLFNMIIVGGNDWHNAFGAYAIDSLPGGKDAPKTAVDDHYLDNAKALGQRVAELTLKINK